MEIMKLLPGGLWPVMLTPFKDDNTVDFEGLQRLTEFYIRAGANGFFANCLSSEMFDLSEEERLSIIKTVVETAGNIPVVASGTFVKEISQNALFIKKVFDLGVKAVIVNSNQLVSEDENENSFKIQLEKLLVATGNIPLGIYECPVPYKRLLSSSLMEWMGKTGRFLYHKDTSCDLSSITQKLQAVKGSLLGLYNANMPTALQSLKEGARGISPIGANYFPEIYSFLYNGFLQRNHKKEIFNLNALMSVIDPLIHNFYPYSAKAFLQRRGLKITTKTRIDISPMSSQDVIKFHDLYMVFEKTMEEYGIKKVI